MVHNQEFGVLNIYTDSHILKYCSNILIGSFPTRYLITDSFPRTGSQPSWQPRIRPPVAALPLCSRPSRQGCPGQGPIQNRPNIGKYLPGTLGIFGTGQ